MLKAVVEFAAYGVAATLAAVCILVWAWKWSGWTWTAVSRQLRRSALAVMVAMAVVATMKAQKGGRGPGTAGDPPALAQQTGTTGVSPVEDITDTFHFSAISVPTSGTVTLTTAWTNGFLAAGQTLDILVKTDLRDGAWSWLTNGVVEVGATNMSWTIANQSPSNSFYKAVVRDTLTNLDDPDGDGLPNVYELAHGRNPWVRDYALVQKLTVGTNETYATLTAALAASEPYSVIEIVPGVYELSSPVVMPSYPVMVTAAEPYAVIRSTASLGVFEINTGQNEETLFRNLYLWLGATSGFQVGFWCGGNLPWDGVPNTHSFKQELTVSVTNTASTAYTVYTAWGYSPTNWEENGLVAFPNGHGMNLYTNASPQGATHVKAFCDLNANGNYDVDDDILIVRAIPCGDTARFNFTFGDIDGDGLSDAQERQYGTDPYLFDSDNDGVDDRTEILDGTDPMDLHSFTQRLFVTVTNTASTAYAVYTAWGDSTRVWEANEQVIFPQGFGNTTYTNASLHGATHVKAFCDLNGNGEYDANADVLLMYQIPNGSTARIALVFGDVDGDGVPDAQERSEGTDPYDGGNFRLVATVNVESSDAVPGLTNYVAWGYMSPGWEENGLDSFTGRSLPFPVDEPVTNGELFVKVFRDFNTNGVYDAGFDAFITKKLTRSDNGKTVKLSIGDSDSDHVPDNEEINESTDPLDGINYCFRLAVEVTGIFHTTNSLTLSATFGDTTPCAPTVMDTNVWSMDFGHLLATNGEKVVLTIWDDANSNLVCDVEETSYRRELGPTGHVNVISFNMPYGNFDRDNNSLPDWWETVHGLTSVTNGGPYADTDGDGLINLHEFWCGTHPLVPDGSNTLLSVTARAIDVRLYGTSATNPLCLFGNYFVNGSNGVFQINTNFWAKDVDFSGICVWNSSEQHNQRAGALISPRHLLMANHWYPTSTNEVLYFRGKSGCVYSRQPVRWRGVSVPNSVSSYPDTGVVLLNEPLDTNDVSVISIFSTNLLSKVGSGYAVPFIYLNRNKEALVKEIRSLTSGAGDPNWHHISFMRPLVSVRQPFVTDVLGIPGDSSSPSFVLIDNKLVVFGMHSRTTSDSPVFLFTQQIQQTMDVLATGYELIIEDLSIYPDIQ